MHGEMGVDNEIILPNRLVGALEVAREGFRQELPQYLVSDVGRAGSSGEAVHPVSADPLCLALIDCCKLSQECLVSAFQNQQPALSVSVFSSADEYIRAARQPFEMILYYTHSHDMSDAATRQFVTKMQRHAQNIPLILVSGAENAEQPDTIRGTLRSGVRGYIPARTAGVAMTLAVLRFVRAGGTFAPLDLLLADGDGDHGPSEGAEQREMLTSRQTEVLALLQLGKANKIIAHQLGMSESTVKAHVRNIMRMMGVRNRTQAACNAQGWMAARSARPL